MTPTTPTITPGFIALHGNRTEDLAQTVIDWLRRTPLDPLEEEVVLVQSNGVAEWFKMALAQRAGVCSATRVELPSRFIWRSYRQIFGSRNVPRDSPLDKLPMTWRVLKVLPELLPQATFSPLQRYLAPKDAERQVQLAAKLADLFDQYQNYRADWLQAWEDGQDVLIQADGRQVPIPEDQRWQPALWRCILARLSAKERQAIRPHLHQQAIARLLGATDYAGVVARRVVVYGMSHLPGSTLETLAALSRHSQVLLAVPNPCRYYWGDIIDGRELLKARHQRQPLRNGVALSGIALEDMHVHAHPLLAAWGRQSRDFLRQLDWHDDPQATQRQFDFPRIDLFDDTPETAQTTLLQRLQNRIRDLEPVQDESAHVTIPAHDQSIAFHIAHSPVRELEILQDRLLDWLGDGLHPRDVVVMVPDIDRMAPLIRAVFGQYPRYDPRFIPFDIADLDARSNSPLVNALTWLLRLPTQRCTFGELVDLLEVPALAARFGLKPESLPTLTQWLAGAGMRWGLEQEHRNALGLDRCGTDNSAWFALQRMLLGFACGTLADVPGNDGWDGIEPYAEIGGLDAELAGLLAHLLAALRHWWQQARGLVPPSEWVVRGRALLQALFVAVDETDRQTLAALDEALGRWHLACEQAAFDDPVDLAALRHAWLQGLELPQLHRRFCTGGVTFCTLMPMRAVPFAVVCLLGMNDGDYPRRSMHSDFDLMAHGGQLRPGDRSRQQDDRQLMLEAVLSARSKLYLSWSGHSVRDNSKQPPSVLVSQLRDYLAAVWGEAAVQQCTVEHPLQPFGRRYFELDSTLHTHAREWRRLHVPEPANAAKASAKLPPLAATPLTLVRLATFLRNPVKAFFRERLGVVFPDLETQAPDTEAFAIDGLEHYQLLQSLVRDWPSTSPNAADIDAEVKRLRRCGVLPLHGFGDIKQAELLHILQRMSQDWQAIQQEFDKKAPRVLLELRHDAVLLRDWIEHLHGSAEHTTWLHLEPGKVLDKDKKNPRPDKLLLPWLRALGAAACGHALHGVLVAQDGTLRITPMPQEEAQAQMGLLLDVWWQGMQAPLPLPLKTALAHASGIGQKKAPNPAAVYEGNDFDASMAEVNDPCLARVFPDFDALCQTNFAVLAQEVYLSLLHWVRGHVTATPPVQP